MEKIPNITSRRKSERKAIKFIAIVFALMFVVLGLSTASWAAGATVFKFTARSKLVFASFESTDTSVCNTGIITSVSVTADDNVFQTPPGPGAESSTIDVFVSQFDTCTSTFPCIFGFTSLADADFQVNAESATLITKLTAIDCNTGNPISPDMSVNLTWTGNGQPRPTNDHVINQTPKSIFKLDARGTTTPAQASGTISIGITNFTPDPALDANIVSTLNGQLTIIH